MQALDIAEGKMEAATTAPPIMSLPDGESDSSGNSGGAKLQSFLLQAVRQLDQGDGVDFDTVLKNAASRGHARELAEQVLDEMVEAGQLEEPRFGWFRAVAAE